MQIYFSTHARERAEERGASETEVIDVLNNGTDIEAKGNKQAKEKVFAYASSRNGKYYQEKKVQVIYIIENEVIVIITVYVFFGKFQLSLNEILNRGNITDLA